MMGEKEHWFDVLVQRPRGKALEYLNKRCVKGAELLEELLFQKHFGDPTQVEQNHWEFAQFIAKLHSGKKWARYRAQIRNLVFNLQHSPSLQNLGDGNYHWLVFEATPQELWPEKHARPSAAKGAMTRAQLEEMVGESSLYKCKRCKSKYVRHHQMQTRSADEPMTTFFHCVSCDKRWKIN
jgi:hypothetical protein